MMAFLVYGKSTWGPLFQRQFKSVLLDAVGKPETDRHERDKPGCALVFWCERKQDGLFDRLLFNAVPNHLKLCVASLPAAPTPTHPHTRRLRCSSSSSHQKKVLRTDKTTAQESNKAAELQEGKFSCTFFNIFLYFFYRVLRTDDTTAQESNKAAELQEGKALRTYCCLLLRLQEEVEEEESKRTPSRPYGMGLQPLQDNLMARTGKTTLFPSFYGSSGVPSIPTTSQDFKDNK